MKVVLNFIAVRVKMYLPIIQADKFYRKICSIITYWKFSRKL